MVSMTTITGSPVDVFRFTSDSEDYESPTPGQAVVILLGTALLAVPAGIIGLAVAPFILGARAVSALAKNPGRIRVQGAV